MVHKTEQDGFDAIEYPLNYAFKAVCIKNETSSINDLQAIIDNAISGVVGSSAVKKLSSKESRAGNYVSVTALVYLESRQQLESVYNVISNLDVVKMTL